MSVGFGIGMVGDVDTNELLRVCARFALVDDGSLSIHRRDRVLRWRPPRLRERLDALPRFELRHDEYDAMCDGIEIFVPHVADRVDIGVRVAEIGLLRGTRLEPYFDFCAKYGAIIRVDL